MTTDRFTRRATWSAPLILAPCAAAVFGASVWWAAGATPASSSSGAAAGTGQAAAVTQPAVGRHRDSPAQKRALHRQLKQRNRRALRLEHQLQALRAESGHLHVAVPKIPGPAAAPAPPAQPAPAPPPVNTVTGASG